MNKLTLTAALTQTPRFTTLEGVPTLTLNLGAFVGGKIAFVNAQVSGPLALTLRTQLKPGMVLRALGTLETVNRDLVPSLNSVKILHGEETRALRDGGVVAVKGEFAVTLEGNLAAQPTVKSFDRKNGSGQLTVAEESLAARVSSRDEGGNWSDATTWVRIKGFKEVAHAMSTLAKGTLVNVAGVLDVSPFPDKDGRMRSGVKVRVTRITALKLPVKVGVPEVAVSAATSSHESSSDEASVVAMALDCEVAAPASKPKRTTTPRKSKSTPEAVTA